MSWISVVSSQCRAKSILFIEVWWLVNCVHCCRCHLSLFHDRSVLVVDVLAVEQDACYSVWCNSKLCSQPLCPCPCYWVSHWLDCSWCSRRLCLQWWQELWTAEHRSSCLWTNRSQHCLLHTVSAHADHLWHCIDGCDTVPCCQRLQGTYMTAEHTYGHSQFFHLSTNPWWWYYPVLLCSCACICVSLFDKPSLLLYFGNY